MKSLPLQKKQPDCLMPVLKIDFSGKILYANGEALLLLHRLGCTCSASLPKEFYSEHADILKPHCFFDFTMEVEKSCYFFSAVAFDEAGYIGLYNYKVEQLASIQHAA